MGQVLPEESNWLENLRLGNLGRWRRPKLSGPFSTVRFCNSFPWRELRAGALLLALQIHFSRYGGISILLLV
jgi:hypothetical protein